MLGKIVLFILVALMAACSENKEDSKIPSFKLESNENINVNDCSFIDEHQFQVYRINNNSFIEIGGNVSDFVKLDSSLILIKRQPAKIISLNTEGNINWKLSSESDDFRIFSNIGAVSINRYDEQIEVLDYSQDKLFVYDFNGNYLDQQFLEYSYVDKVYISKDESLLHLEYFEENILDCSAETGVIAEKNKNGISCIKTLPPKGKNEISFTDHKSFYQIEDKIFYHPDFSDTIFSYNNGKFKPDYIVELPRREDRLNLLKSKSLTTSKFSELITLNIPFLRNILRVNDDIILGQYTFNKEVFCFVISQKNYSVKQSKYLSYQGVKFSAPLLFREGSILSQTPDFEFDLINGLSYSELNSMNSDELNDLIYEASNNDESGGMVYILITNK